jgi:alkyl hydroperoxide reductase subunit AhpC
MSLRINDIAPDFVPETTVGTIDSTAATNTTVRTAFMIGPDQSIKLMLIYTMGTARNFDEALRVLDSLQLTTKHNVSTPVNWKQGRTRISSPPLTQGHSAAGR